MNYLFASFAIALASLAGSVVCGADAPPATRLPVLIVDGQNNHDWARGTRILKSILVATGRFSVDVSTSPPNAAPPQDWETWHPQFPKYAAVILNYNGHAWSKDLQKSLEDYVRSGGGLVIFHAANNSFPTWPAYNDMIGLGWRDRRYGPSLIVSLDGKIITVPAGQGNNPGHGSEHDFQVTVLDTGHPITQGMPKLWLHPHEQLTHGQHGPAKDMTVLTYAWSKDTHENEVMDWVIPYGKGRVYTTLLGHIWKDGPDITLRCIGFQTLFARGVEWAATGCVTLPIPTDFPTATQIRVAPTTDMPDLAIKLTKKEDHAVASIDHAQAVVTIASVTGIGAATIEPLTARWPAPLVLRLHLHGLESLILSAGKLQLHASVLSHSGNRRLLSLWQDGKEGPELEKTSPYWTDIRALDASGKPISGLPDKDGCFELQIPAALLPADARALQIAWIDFYRQ